MKTSMMTTSGALLAGSLLLLAGSLLLLGCSEAETQQSSPAPSMVSGDKAHLIRQLRAEEIASAEELRAPAGAAARSEIPSAAEFWERAMKDPSRQQVQESESDEAEEWMSLHAAEIRALEIINDPELSALGDTSDLRELRNRNYDNSQTMETLLNGAPDSVRRRFSSP